MMAIWKSWYRGNVNDFHYFTMKMADGTTKQCERLTMNMPKKVCEDFAKLLWSEKVQIKLDKKKNTERLLEVLDSKENNFKVNFPNFLERVFALGTGVTVEYRKDDKTLIDYIDGDIVIPYKYTNSYINGLITVSRFTKGADKDKKYFTHITYHEFKDSKYTKLNELYESNNETTLGEEINFNEKFPDVLEFEEFDTDNPHFQVWEPVVANNFDTDSPMGISIFANQIDKFKAIDTEYDSFNREFRTGKKRVLISREAVKKHYVPDPEEEGKVNLVSYFDNNDEVYVAIAGMEDQPVKEIDFNLRYQEHISSINAQLNYISAGVGLGQNYYNFDGQGVKTATEVVSENSDTYRTKKHHELMVNDCLYDLVKAICELEDIPYKSINIVFDDSIIEDENALIQRGLELYQSKTISLEKFMKKYLHYEDSEIQEEIAKIQSENKLVQPEGMDFFGMEQETEVQDEEVVEEG
ncbi:MAG TPA: phage portal protein [Candidatus Onthousia faecipullorum]|uniref:Phage portal protein n=1 Tax=Candidatus Onthousia faecipullorum TaxID=2840887 RepID=A0A9D1G981_9FIRM|nr:phage portal protein [Candidatus Onthousia faecipullorum]